MLQAFNPYYLHVTVCTLDIIMSPLGFIPKWETYCFCSQNVMEKCFLLVRRGCLVYGLKIHGV